MSEISAPSRSYSPWLWILAALFAFRVVIQPAALWVPGVPPFHSWHSAALPYGVLLVSQLAILSVLVWTARRFTIGDVRSYRRVGLVALAGGAVYFAAMAARLVLGFTWFRGHWWFSRPLPTAFHLVLAAYIVLFGHFHYVHAAGAAGSRKTEHDAPSG